MHYWKILWLMTMVVVWVSGIGHAATREVAITAPDENAVFFDEVSLEGYLIDTDWFDPVQWAIREETCDAIKQAIVRGNVGWFNDPYMWDYDSDTGYHDFVSLASVSERTPTRYCFVLNPKEDNGESDLKADRTFWVWSFSASQWEMYNHISWDHTIEASIGIPVSDYPIVFEVNWVNSLSSTVLTDDEGDATYTYSSDSDGIDTITVCADTNDNGVCDDGEPTESFTKYWLSEMISWGWQLLDESWNKRKDRKKISFGGMVWVAGDAGIVGEWQVNLHNVEGTNLDKSTFHTTEIVDFNRFAPDSGSCLAAVNFTAEGRFNNEDGYTLIVRAGDSGEPASWSTDTVRIQIYDPTNAIVYDSDTEFPMDSTCVGTHRTFQDKGNITILPTIS